MPYRPERTIESKQWIRHVADRIRELRIKARMRQDDVAALLNVDRNTYKLWESGVENMRLATLVDIATKLGVLPAQLFEPVDATLVERRPGRPKRVA